MKNKAISILCLAGVLLTGSVWATPTLRDIPNDATVFSVNGMAVTKKDYNGYLNMMGALYRTRHPMANQMQQRSAKAKMMMAAKNEQLSRLLQYSNLCAGTNKVTVTPAARAMIEKEYCAVFVRKGQTFEDLRAAMEDEEADECFERMYETDVRIRSALMARYPDSFTLSETDISNSVQHVTRYNRMADATNAVICALMTNVLKRVRSGEDFAKLADEFSQDPSKEPGGDLGECTMEAFNGESHDYVMAIAKLKPGEVSGILETESGYEIVRKTADVEKEKSESGESAWRLSRIFFRRPYYLPELEGEVLRERLLKDKFRTLLEERIREYLASAKIEYPFGDIFNTNQGKRKGGKK